MGFYSFALLSPKGRNQKGRPKSPATKKGGPGGRRGVSPNLRFEFLATWPGAILAAGSQRVPLYAPRPGWGGGVTFAARRGHLRGLGHNVRVFRGPLTEKSKLASMLVIWSPRGPRIPMAWGGCVGAAGYPMGCQIGRRRGTKRHWRDLRRPLKFPNLIVSLTRFSHVPGG